MTTKIEWADRTWNPVTGCTKISPGCANCYAERMAKRLQAMGQEGYKNGFEVTCHPERWDEPLKWRKPSRVFVCSMGDLFHEDVPDEFLDKVFAMMARAAQHTFLVLTKRPERMKSYIIKAMYDEDCSYQGWYETIDDLGIPDATPMENVWIGVTAENQEQADKRIPTLLQIPAAVRFVSVEPMLGPVVLPKIKRTLLAPSSQYPGYQYAGDGGYKLSVDWVICGGESGPGARPMHPDWARSLRDQCQAADVPFMFKQWGEWAPTEAFGGSYPDGKYSWDFVDNQLVWKVGKKKAGRLLDGREWDEYPKVTE